MADRFWCVVACVFHSELDKSAVDNAFRAGIAGTFIAIFASSWKYGHFYPWLMPIHALHRTDGKEIIALWVGVLGGLLILIAMNVIESRRDLSK